MIAPIPILTLVHAAFALGERFRGHMQTRARLEPITVYLQQVSMPDPIDFVRFHLPNENKFGPGAPHAAIRDEYRDIWTKDEYGNYVIHPDAPDDRKFAMVDAVIDVCSEAWNGPEDVEENRFAVYTLKSWTNAEEDNRDRNRLILSVCEVALAFLNYRADALGIGDTAERVVGAVAEGIGDYFGAHREEIIQKGFADAPARRLAEALVTTSLSIASERPELFSDKAHVQTLVRAAMEPLRELNADPNTHGLGLTQRVDRVRHALRGPIGIGVLQTLHDKRELFFEDYPDKTKAAGVVTEALFAAVVTDAQDANNVLKVFSPGFFVRTYPSVLDAVAAAPEAFVRGKGEHVKLGHSLLEGMAEAISEHAGDKPDPQLAESLFRISLDLTRRHARRFLVDEARGAVSTWSADHVAGRKNDPWALVSARIVSEIAGRMIMAFEDEGLDGTPFTATMDLELILEIVGLLAEQAAQTPGMILPDNVNPEVVRIAEGVAAFIASDHASLVSRQDWKRVSAKAIELAMQNPNTLFSLTAKAPGDHLAVTLVQKVLGTAHKSLIDQSQGASSGPHRGQGRVLFGQTLASALVTVLDTAAENAQRLRDPQTARALIDFIDQLNALAADRAALGGRALSANDWVYAFRWFVSGVVATGDGHVPAERILSIVAAAERRAAANAPAPSNDTPANAQPDGAAAASAPGVSPAVHVRDGTTHYTHVSIESAKG